MTGQCYYCAAEQHGDCHSTQCTCCGQRNQQHEAAVAELLPLLRASLAPVLARQRNQQ